MTDKEDIQKLYDEFSQIIGAFLQTVDDNSLFIVFEKVIEEMNNRNKQREG